jgi:hypothetical protein
MTDSRPNPREGVGRKASKPPAVRPRSFRFIADSNSAGTGILVEQVDGVRHARAARFFWRGR